MIDIVLTSKKGVFMKSTKNLLLTNIALAIALFGSVQITAMEDQQAMEGIRNRVRINQQTRIINEAREEIAILEEYLDPKNPRSRITAPQTKQACKKEIANLLQSIEEAQAEIDRIKNNEQ